jgi:hypothetical protein
MVIMDKITLTTISQTATSGDAERTNITNGDNSGINQALMPMTLFSMIAFYISLFSVMNPDTMLTKIIAANIIYERIPIISETIPTIDICIVNSFGSILNPRCKYLL